MRATPQTFLIIGARLAGTTVNVWDGTDTTAALVRFRVRDTHARLLNPEAALADIQVDTMSGTRA